ncbi:MAG: hypothetical protein OQK82_04805 [Candidatus Pacearchaeota archaeon]|nr:hypothetical protein [Candidatus Pacearchaeota archaeon]
MVDNIKTISSEEINAIKSDFLYLEAVREELGDYSKIPYTQYTAAYFVCRDKYTLFRNAFKKFEECINNLKKVDKRKIDLRVQELEYLSKLLIDTGSKPYSTVNRDILPQLNLIPGCETRELKRKIPKGFDIYGEKIN